MLNCTLCQGEANNRRGCVDYLSFLPVKYACMWTDCTDSGLNCSLYVRVILKLACPVITVRLSSLSLPSFVFPPVDCLSSTANCVWDACAVSCLNCSLCVRVILRLSCSIRLLLLWLFVVCRFRVHMSVSVKSLYACRPVSVSYHSVILEPITRPMIILVISIAYVSVHSLFYYCIRY